MKIVTWRKHHRWLGLALGLFLIMFCLSGLVLNHPSLFSHCNVGREVLPDEYQFRQWNRGLMRGTVKWNDQVLIYGYNGVWMTDSVCHKVCDFNKGLPSGADFRNIRDMALTRSGRLYALGQYALYEWSEAKRWVEVDLPSGRDERLSGLTTRGDSVIVAGRSHLYLAVLPSHSFREISLAPGSNADGRVTMFRLMWLLHSGALFGMVGRLIVDFIALVLLFLTLSGFIYWLLPLMGRGKHTKIKIWMLNWHNKIGKWSLVLTLFLCITGWFLRPPMLIAIASGKVPAIPFTALDVSNSWNDKLRSIRYDAFRGDYLLSTSEGFYALKDLKSVPQYIEIQPPVSVMGINVLCQKTDGVWLAGSFSGMYLWDRQKQNLADYFTLGPVKQKKGMPIGAHVVAGASLDLGNRVVVADYNRGVEGLPMPQWMSVLPMSLSQVCLEIHTGRIYTFMGMGNILYIFVVGLAMIWCLWSGWKIRISRKKRK